MEQYFVFNWLNKYVNQKGALIKRIKRLCASERYGL